LLRLSRGSCAVGAGDRGEFGGGWGGVGGGELRRDKEGLASPPHALNKATAEKRPIIEAKETHMAKITANAVLNTVSGGDGVNPVVPYFEVRADICMYMCTYACNT